MLEGPVTIGCGLTCLQLVHLVCSVYFFDTVLYETLFSFNLVEFVLLFIQSPRHLFEQECVGLVSRTIFQPLPVIYSRHF